jgi:hypothetical protein
MRLTWRVCPDCRQVVPVDADNQLLPHRVLADPARPHCSYQGSGTEPARAAAEA